MKRTLRLLAPYLAVGIFWCVFNNAWLAILTYHAQILFWSRRSLLELRRIRRTRLVFLALSAAIVGPLFYFVLPYVTRVDPASWLANHQLTRLSLLAMIPYFGLVHPLLEQLHWSPLRESTPIAHVAFAGYHVLVLYSVLRLPWRSSCVLSFSQPRPFCGNGWKSGPKALLPLLYRTCWPTWGLSLPRGSGCRDSVCSVRA